MSTNKTTKPKRKREAEGNVYRFKIFHNVYAYGIITKDKRKFAVLHFFQNAGEDMPECHEFAEKPVLFIVCVHKTVLWPEVSEFICKLKNLPPHLNRFFTTYRNIIAYPGEYFIDIPDPVTGEFSMNPIRTSDPRDIEGLEDTSVWEEPHVKMRARLGYMGFDVSAGSELDKKGAYIYVMDDYEDQYLERTGLPREVLKEKEVIWGAGYDIP